MSDTPPSAAPEPRKLDDVLLAMDVVDTLRHRERMVDRELDAETREAELIERLKEIYHAQGIEVPDRILKDGVKALEEQRFVYKPPKDTFAVRLAKLYVSRARWLPAAAWGTGGVVAVLLGWQVFWAGPQAAAWKRLPDDLRALSAEARALAEEPAVDERLAAIERAGLREVDARDRSGAKEQLETLRDLKGQLEAEYDVRIVSRPGEDTGFYRIPNDNPLGRNYYLVVEAVAPGGDLLTVPIFNEETQKTERVAKWAQRVSQATFERVAADKAPDQIVQNDILGHKKRGALEPAFDASSPGGAITKW